MNDTAYKGPRDPINAPSNSVEPIIGKHWRTTTLADYKQAKELGYEVMRLNNPNDYSAWFILLRCYDDRRTNHKCGSGIRAD